jgi:iron complex transport system permease protein
MPPARLTRRRIVAVLALLGVSLLAGACIALGIGSTRVPPTTLIKIILGGSVPAEVQTILIQVRLARVLLAALTGAALACAGTAFQAVLRNPLADPYILGISGGAALGAILVSLGGAAGPAWARPAAAFAGACLTVLAILSLSRSRGVSASTPMLLIGWIFNSFFLALILFLETAVDFSRVRGAIFWLVGTLAPEPFPVLGVLSCVVLAGIVALWLLARDFNLLCAGEESARFLGCNVERTRLLGVLAASLITASVVSFGGLIGFVGLIVPHAARYLFGPDHRLLLPASALLGATGLVLADAASRTLLAPTEVPVGVLTVLVGGPLFILLYRHHRGEVSAD